ncbi:MAG: leucine-rich repeat domain-containing protein, partial [Lachnospiraceae bacterium]|nr:leucine-rich repeat domain-containing protein [Lachnospiraceae bacterium]
LKLPKKRDEMIVYATENNKTESLAWLLEYKNRTTDITVEQEKAEKNMMRELNAAPDSVVSLKKIWSYRKEEDGTLTITNYKGTALEVTVPERIGKSVVTAIGKAAFTGQTYMKAEDRHRLSVADRFNPRVTDEQIKQHQEITKIVLPETIQSIGAGAFDRMQALREIHLPKGVKEIGFSAFSGCSSLKRITIPDNIEKISESTFFRAALEEIVIPGKVHEIEKMAFVQCNALKRITIPENVKKIGEHAFSQCTKLEMLCICEGVEEIGEDAFGGCISLKTLTIPGTVKRVKKDAFHYCKMLESVQICEGVEEIEEGAFARCQNLKKVSIPKSVRRIRSKKRSVSYDVFEECPKLIVVCPKGSRAEAYCKRKNIKNQFV